MMAGMTMAGMATESGAVTIEDVRIHYLAAGSGPALLLLHGWPQTSHTWRKVMPALAAHYRVVAPDLRGMGASDLPYTGYDMRSVAADIAGLIDALGLEDIYLVGTDWGALTARRLVLDWPGRVRRLAVLDMVPAERILEDFTIEKARNSWHYFFNSQPDLPERLIGRDVEGFLRAFFRRKYHDPADMEDGLPVYVRAYSQPGALRASLGYYRAIFEENRALDRESAGRLIEQPVLALWGNSGGFGAAYDVLAAWRKDARTVTGQGYDRCGHYLQEEIPETLVAQLLAFDGIAAASAD